MVRELVPHILELKIGDPTWCDWDPAQPNK